MRLPNVGLVALGLLGLERSAAAQQRLVIQGFAEAEGWRTTGGSALLARNHDAPGLAGGLVLWGAADLSHHFLLVALTELRAGAATEERSSEAALEELTLRWQPSPAFELDLGRFPAPLGAFAARRLAPSNPVIGSPDGYDVNYPIGGQVSGAIGRFDYRAALLDRPITNQRYLPRAGRRLRPALGAGFSPAAGIRLGLSYTAGSYLSDSATVVLSPNEQWQEYRQRLVVIDGLITRGYLEIRGESAFSSYDVPEQAKPVTGNASFVEVRYTWTPRFFTAARLERNAYAFIQPVGPRAWFATQTTFYDGEAGIGIRLDPVTLVKVSYRRDDWRVSPPLDQILRNGSALAVQVSRGFDLTSWFRNPR